MVASAGKNRSRKHGKESGKEQYTLATSVLKNEKINDNHNTIWWIIFHVNLSF